MASSKQRVNYDLIAHLYDEPGRDYETDPNLIEFFNEKIGRKTSRFRILDMGCGTGKQLAANRHKFPETQAVGLDLFHRMLLQARKRSAAIDWVQGDNTNPPFADDSFDYITNQFSYHHVQDKNGLMVTAFRMLKPGGRFVVLNLDPWSMPGWIVYRYFPTSRQRDLVDFLPVDQLTALMERTGFGNIHVEYKDVHVGENLHEFLAYASQRHRTSQLMVISNDEYEEGIASLKDDVRRLGMEARLSSEIRLIWAAGDRL